MTYVASFAISLGPIFWLLNAEIYPLSVRSKAAGIGTMANWTFNFIVSLTFLLLIEALGRSGAFWFYGAIGIVTLIFCWKLVPETKGKRLEDIQAYFQARVDRHKSPPRPAGYPPGMRIDEIIAARKPTFSVEFFPPKTRGGDRAALRDGARAQPLEPDFVSVTYGAGGSTRDGTVEITTALKDEIGFETMAHLSCVGETTEGLATTLDRIAAAGIDNVFALRGDPPRGEGDFVQPEGGLGSAAELAAFIGAGWDFAIGGACFPEVHPEAPDLETDLAYLKTKVDAGAGFLITQLFFDNQVYFDFVRAARERGIEVPILAGVIPVASFAQTKRICDLCDASIPPRLEAAFEAAGGDPRAGVRARHRLRDPAVRRAADRRRARHPLLRAQQGAGDAGGARRAACLAAVGAGSWRRRHPDQQGRIVCSGESSMGRVRGKEAKLRQERIEAEKAEKSSDRNRLIARLRDRLDRRCWRSPCAIFVLVSGGDDASADGGTPTSTSTPRWARPTGCSPTTARGSRRPPPK